MVRIVKAPREAKYLAGMVCEVIDTAPLCLKTPGGFTYLPRSAVVKEANNETA